MSGPFESIRQLLQSQKLDDSLLFLARLMSVLRKEASDPELEQWISRLKTPPPPFLIHFVAKWLLLESSNFGPNVLDIHAFRRIQDLYFQLDDPIVHDPEWVNAETSGFFERMLANQLPAQGRFKTLDIGLPLALFRDAGAPRKAGDYDLRADLEAELGMPIEQFMAMGYLCRSLAFVKETRVTFTPMYLAEAFRQGIEWCRPESWAPFLRRASCTRDEFRSLLQHTGISSPRPSLPSVRV